MARVTLNGDNQDNRIEVQATDFQDYLIQGLGGNDILSGGASPDVLVGGTGNDTISGRGGNDILKGYGGLRDQGATQEFDQLTGGEGSDLFDLRDAVGSPGYVGGGDILNPTNSSGFALITDFKVTEGDKIQLSGPPAHYALQPISWGQGFGNATTATTTDVALIYIGSEQDQSDVVAVFQDVSVQFLNNPAGFLNNPDIFVSGNNNNYVHPQPIVLPGPNPTPTPTPNPNPTPLPSPTILINGTPRADRLTGSDANNAIVGLGGKDRIKGAGGNDILVGGAGKDVLTGGAGADQFAYAKRKHGGDRIVDFSSSEGDKVTFTAQGFGGLDLGALNSAQFVMGKQAKDGNDRFIYDRKSGSLFYDADGIGSGAQVKMATFANKPALTSNDILIVASPF